MSSRLASISSSPTLKAFAQGAAQDATQPVADFLAPVVPVATSTGYYKEYSEKHRFHIPKTLRSLGGRATELHFEASDKTYNCQPHSLDFPVDNLERLESQGLEDMLKEGAVAVAEVASLAHEKQVIDLALAAAGSGTNKTWNSSSDPVDDLDSAVLDVLKAAKYGSLMGVGILFGATAFKIFKNAANVRGRIVSGSGGSTKAAGLAVVNENVASDLIMGKPACRTSFMVYDTAPEGKDASMSFVLDNTVLIFARKASPTRRDPSFMKTFRLMNQYMVPGSYMRDDGRVEVAKFDWSSDPRVTNSAAVIRLNISAS